MRGLVMEVKGNTLIVLTAQGNYIRIKNTGSAAIGDFVPCDRSVAAPIHWVPRNVMAVAASLLLFCTAGLGAYGYTTPFGTVNIDINPSVALTYNWFQQVIAVEALNADAEQLVAGMSSLKHRPVPEAVEAVVAAASQAGYLEPELANVVFISVSDRSSLVRTAGLMDSIEQDLAQHPEKIETVLFAGTAKTFEKVQKTHESPKEELVESSLDDTPENDPVTHSEKPLKEILKEQKEKKERHEKTESDSDDQTPQSDDDEKDKPNPQKPIKNEPKEKPEQAPGQNKDRREPPEAKPEQESSTEDMDEPESDSIPPELIPPEDEEDQNSEDHQQQKEEEQENEQERQGPDDHEEQNSEAH